MTHQRASQGLGSVPGVARKTLVNTSSLSLPSYPKISQMAPRSIRSALGETVGVAEMDVAEVGRC